MEKKSIRVGTDLIIKKVVRRVVASDNLND
jgi:hypothetical protein